MKLSLLLPLIAVTSANPSSGRVSIEVDHINTDVVTPACHDILIKAFDMAYEEVYRVKDMTNSFDTYDASPECWGQGRWWKYIYYSQWVSVSMENDATPPPASHFHLQSLLS